jgi:cytochrome c oxidase subunit 4
MSEPVTPVRTYVTIFLALIALTGLTVALSFLHLGVWHTPVGLAIAATKAALVGLFFMHLLHQSKIYWLALGAGLFWFGIMMGLTLTDYGTRHWVTY